VNIARFFDLLDAPTRNTGVPGKISLTEIMRKAALLNGTR